MTWARPPLMVPIVGVGIVGWGRLHRVLAQGHVRRGVAGVVGLSIGHPCGCRHSIGHCWAVARSVVDRAAWHSLGPWVDLSTPQNDLHLQQFYKHAPTRTRHNKCAQEMWVCG